MTAKRGQGIIEYALILAFVIAGAAVLIDNSLFWVVVNKFKVINDFLCGNPK